jgi:GMP synthase PP-ATPase subunit
LELKHYSVTFGVILNPKYIQINFKFQVVGKMVSEIESVNGISRVLYDLTAKPPGTTEWE